MEDVVFSGSEGKSAHNMAEVTLVFDNSHRVFSSLENVTEVSIKRRYDKIRNSELSVDDLRTWQGVVLGRAVSTLRSV
jgi:chromosome segregation protein